MTLEQDQTDYYWNLLMVSVWEPLLIQKFELLSKNHQIKPETQGKAMEWNAVTHSAKSHHGTDSKNFSRRVRGLQLQTTELKKDLDIVLSRRMNVCHCTEQPWPTRQKPQQPQPNPCTYHLRRRKTVSSG